MAKIPNQSNLQVTFSKRRSGIFKKASELCTLCGVEVAIIVFSPANKPFSFGHPSVDSVVDRFLIGQKNSFMKYSISGNSNQISSNSHSVIHELNMNLTQLLSQLESERKKGQELDRMKSHCWWESPVDELSLSELEFLETSMEELKNKINLAREGHMIGSDHEISTAHFPQFFPMNGGAYADLGVLDNKPVDDFTAHNFATNVQATKDFDFVNKIF